jgi:hypothetical protein
MPRIYEDISIHINSKSYILDAKKLMLNTIYMPIYTMAYITKYSLEKDILYLVVQEKFKPTNMNIYFGYFPDLNCDEVRILYKQMVEYFINLFKMKMSIIVNIDKKNEDNDSLCVIAHCASIIRGSIKKYVRYRTLLDQWLCSKNVLNRRNAKDHSCPYPISNNIMCPEFKNLKETRSCKKILESSTKTNNFYSILATITPFKPLYRIKNDTMIELPSIDKGLQLKYNKINRQTRKSKRPSSRRSSNNGSLHIDTILNTKLVNRSNWETMNG